MYPSCICPHPLFMKNNHYRWQLGAKTRKDILAGAVRSLRFKDFTFLSLLSKVKQHIFTGDANNSVRFKSPGEDKIGNFEWQVLLDTFSNLLTWVFGESVEAKLDPLRRITDSHGTHEGRRFFLLHHDSWVTTTPVLKRKAAIVVKRNSYHARTRGTN